MTQVHCQRGRAATCVQVERLSLLHARADPIQVAMRVEDGPAQPGMQGGDAASADSQALHPGQQRLRDDGGPKVLDELHVVDLAAHLHRRHDHLRLCLRIPLFGAGEVSALQGRLQPAGRDRGERQVRELCLAEGVLRLCARALHPCGSRVAEQVLLLAPCRRGSVAQACRQGPSKPSPVDHRWVLCTCALPWVWIPGLRAERRRHLLGGSIGGRASRFRIHTSDANSHNGIIDLLHSIGGWPVAGTSIDPVCVWTLH
mmetsp:Transcript_124211/g.362551  ORF Transcript_124211/g.362551 Transcript_124211/m.362551 type:complete len:258 (+) Transcript_124211:1018-1791(+)